MPPLTKDEILKKLEQIQLQKAEAIKNQEFEKAASLRDYEKRLFSQLEGMNEGQRQNVAPKNSPGT